MNHTMVAERRARAAQACRAQGAEALLVYGNAWWCDALRYVSGFGVLEGHAVALLAEGRVRLFLESRAEARRAAAECPDVEAIWLSPFFPSLRAVVEALPAGLAHAPRAHLPEGLARALPPGSVDMTEALDQLLMRKLPSEIEAVRRATALADEGYEAFRHAARAGRTEYEVIADLEAFFRSRGCPDNFMIMASGGTEVRAMHPPGARRLRPGDFVTTELTPCIEGYYAQICRTLVIGPPSPAQQKAFDVHLEALEAGVAATRPGVTAGHLATVQNDVFRRHGLAAYITSEYTRVRGHGLGLYVDTRPALLEADDTVLREDMTLIVHPNGYHPESGYLVLGDMVVLRPGGHEVLTATPRRLFSVPA